ncbi:MAG: hypothetical protein E5X78_28595, partial [Mesorhizobium sp.]
LGVGVFVGRKPSLSICDSPAARGEIICSPAFANRRRLRVSGARKLLISPLKGEMAGRPEGVSAGVGGLRNHPTKTTATACG